jgi:hypothetical protein
MPTPTYTPLATVTLGSATSSVTFSSIPATYRDLILVVEGSLSATAGFRLRVNSDSGSNYSIVDIKGAGSATSEAFTDPQFLPATTTSSPGARFTFQGQFMDYSATDKHKTVLFRAALNASTTEASAQRWANTAAINQMNLFLNTGNYESGTTLNLYGVIA